MYRVAPDELPGATHLGGHAQGRRK